MHRSNDLGGEGTKAVINSLIHLQALCILDLRCSFCFIILTFSNSLFLDHLTFSPYNLFSRFILLTAHMTSVENFDMCLVQQERLARSQCAGRGGQSFCPYITFDSQNWVNSFKLSLQVRCNSYRRINILTVH